MDLSKAVFSNGRQGQGGFSGGSEKSPSMVRARVRARRNSTDGKRMLDLAIGSAIASDFGHVPGSYVSLGTIESDGTRYLLILPATDGDKGSVKLHRSKDAKSGALRCRTQSPVVIDIVRGEFTDRYRSLEHVPDTDNPSVIILAL